MKTTLHFIDVGQGNMTLIETPTGHVVLYDCHVTDDNAYRVLTYVQKVVGRRPIAFIASHRDADHIRGILRVNQVAPIGSVWDAGVSGSTTGCQEYREYMALRDRVQTYALN